MVRARSIAVLACLALAALPPVWSDGYVLRPETPAALFGSLSVLLLQGLPVMARSRHHERLGRGLYQLALMCAVGIALGLAVSALNSYTIYLLLPSAMLFLALVVLILRFGRLMRRRGFARLPVRSFALGLLPWVGAAFFTLLFSWMRLASEIGPPSTPQPGTVADEGLL